MGSFFEVEAVATKILIMRRDGRVMVWLGLSGRGDRNWQHLTFILGFPGGSEIKAPACNAGDLGSIPWRRKWQPTPVLLPGESRGQRSLVGYSPRGCKELDMTEQLHSTFIYFPSGSDSKESACNVGDMDSVPGSGRPPGEGNNNLLQYSCLGNSMEPSRLQSMGLQRVKPDLATNISFTFVYHHFYLGPTNWSTMMYGCSGIVCVSY